MVTKFRMSTHHDHCVFDMLVLL